MLGFRQIYHSYGDKVVLQGVSCVLTPGTVTGVLGPNGCGKSTLVKLLLGLLPVQRGEIQWHGQNALDRQGFIGSSVRSQTGFLTQNSSSDERLSGWRNLDLAGQIYGIASDARLDRMRILLEKTNLWNSRQQMVKAYSGGMRRRLELARAFLHAPQIAVFDEPSAGLDETGYRLLWELIYQEITSKGGAALVVTHRLDEAEKCDKLLFLNNGKILAEGTPKELKALVKPEWLDQILLDDIGAITNARPNLADVFLQLSGVKL